MYALLEIVFVAAMVLIGTLSLKDKEDKSFQTICIVLIVIVIIVVGIAQAPYRTYD